MYKCYNGQITISLSTIVTAQEDSTKERNSAHEAIDLELLKELQALAEARGYISSFVSLDLHLMGESGAKELEYLNKNVQKAKNKEDEIRGKTTVTKVYF